MNRAPSFFDASAKGVFWSVGAKATGQAFHLAIRVVLARLLVPEDFGLVAMSMVVIGLTWGIVEMSFGPALVQRKELTEAHKSTAFWSNVLMSFAVFACLSALSPLAAWFFGADGLTPVLVALSLSVVLGSPETTLTALLQRDFNFRALALRNILSVVFGGVLGIALALKGMGVWALVGYSLVQSFTGSLLLFWKSRWRPSFEFDGRAFSDLWSYSRSLMGARFLNYFNRQLDTILVGRFLGAANLGLYNLGYQFVLFPLTYITRTVSTVLLSTLSRLQDEEERFRSAYLQTLELVAFATFPLMTAVFLSAPLLVPAVLGEKWAPSVPLIPFFCFSGLLQSINGLAPYAFQAKGKTALVLKWTLISALFNAAAFIIGLKWGIKGVSAAYAASNLALTPVVIYMLGDALGVSMGSFLKTLRHPAYSSAAFAFVWVLAGLAVESFNPDLKPALRAAALLVVCSSVYLLVSLRFNPALKKTLQRAMRAG